MSAPGWSARGLLFENCSCRLICPAHVSFESVCNHDRCRGHWGVDVAAGCYGDDVLSKRYSNFAWQGTGEP